MLCFHLNNLPTTRLYRVRKNYRRILQKPYFHKYWTEIHDVTNIWKRNICSFIATLNAFDVRPTCDTADLQAILPFPPNGSMSYCVSGTPLGVRLAMDVCRKLCTTHSSIFFSFRLYFRKKGFYNILISYAFHMTSPYLPSQFHYPKTNW
jgi:hypothetical protein